MENFFDYYYRLRENPPERYSSMGYFGEAYWHKTINEGLITSYPIEKVEQFLKAGAEVRGTDITYQGTDQKQTIIIATIELCYYGRTIEDVVDELNKKLLLYGYFVGRTDPQSSKIYTALIEPKYPTTMDKSKISKLPFFHVSHRKYVEEILKVGLTPGTSQTIFTHPGGRVYVVQSRDDSYILDELKHVLSSFKDDELLRTSPDRHAKLKERDIEWSEKNMVVFKVKIPEKSTLYFDPMLPSVPNNYKAFFITDNIPTQNIEPTNY